MDFMDTKLCRDCGISKPMLDFYAAASRKDGRASYCKPCHNARNRSWGAANPEKLKESMAAAKRRYLGLPARAPRGPVHGPPVPTGLGRAATGGRLHGPPIPAALEKRREKLAARFGITPAEYQRLLEAQGGVCALCSGTDPDRRLAVDHCHETGVVRGLLCFSCNTGIGKLGDTADALYRAWQYVAGAA